MQRSYYSLFGSREEDMTLLYGLRNGISIKGLAPSGETLFKAFPIQRGKGPFIELDDDEFLGTLELDGRFELPLLSSLTKTGMVASIALEIELVPNSREETRKFDHSTFQREKPYELTDGEPTIALHLLLFSRQGVINLDYSSSLDHGMQARYDQLPQGTKESLQLLPHRDSNLLPLLFAVKTYEPGKVYTRISKEGPVPKSRVSSRTIRLTNESYIGQRSAPKPRTLSRAQVFAGSLAVATLALGVYLSNEENRRQLSKYFGA